MDQREDAICLKVIGLAVAGADASTNQRDVFQRLQQEGKAIALNANLKLPVTCSLDLQM